MSEEPKKKEKVFRVSEEVDPNFKYELSKIHGAENLTACFQCGTCTADCPVARFSGSYRPLQILRMAILGMKQRVLSSNDIWLCAACYTCTDRCPRDVEFASVLRVLRNIAVKEGYTPETFKLMGSNIVETGSAYKMPESRLKKRETAGLPPLPKSNPQRLARLSKAVGFSKIIEKGGEQHA